jgi:hypothetical protein
MRLNNRLLLKSPSKKPTLPPVLLLLPPLPLLRMTISNLTQNFQWIVFAATLISLK